MSTAESLEEFGLFEEELPETIDVSTHARLAYLERVDPMETYPAARVRNLWERSSPAPNHPRARRSDGLYLVYDVRRERTIILTVYPKDRRVSA